MTDKLDIGALHNFYHGLSDLVGPEAMMKIYEQYKGTQLSVPVHLYDRDLAAQRVVREFNGHNQQDLPAFMAIARSGSSQSCVRLGRTNNWRPSSIVIE